LVVIKKNWLRAKRSLNQIITYMKKLIMGILLLLFACRTYAQHSGNVVYGYNNSQVKRPDPKKLQLTDSTFLIQANVLLNAVADNYVVTFGAADSAANLAESNNRINRRIVAFTRSLAAFHIKPADIYVDMTSQNRIYDYTLKRNLAEQYVKAYEVKKNVIIKFKNITDLDNIMLAAAKYEIYDLIKVDYLMNDPGKIHADLFKQAVNIINQKKEMYTLATNVKLVPGSVIYMDDMQTYFPTQLYKTYTAESSSNISAEYTTLIRKDLKRQTTYYYDKIDYSGFDLIINPAITEPAVEFALTLQIVFKVDKASLK
jgi:uncharacterized protein YggE